MLQYNPSISGSLNITGSLIISNGMIGTVNGVDVQIFSSSINQVITGIQAATGSQEGRLGSIESFTSSTSARLNSIETISASNISRLSSLETTSASVDTLNTTQNTRLTNLENKTGSLATTGSNTFYGQQVFSGSLYVQNDLVVQGSSSLQNITASAVSIGTNIVNLNTANPAVRYGGISVQDSGSASGVTGSMLWDSTCNRWVYANPSGVGYSGGIIMSGPRAATLGGEVTLTCNYIAKSGGGDHLYDSCIQDVSGSVTIGGTLCTSGVICASSLATTCFKIDANGDAYQSTTGATALWGAIGNSQYPTYGFYGNTGMGMYRGGTDTLSFTVNNSDRLRILNGGIACFSCQICSANITTSNNDAYSYIQSKSNTATARLNAGCNGSADVFIGRCTNSVYANVLYVDTNNWDGTCFKWSVGMRTGGSNYTIYNEVCSYTALFVCQNNGFIGIGTTTPAELLTLYRNANADNRFAIYQGTAGYASAINLIGNDDAGTAYNAILSRTGANTAHWQIGGGGIANTMKFYTTGCERMMINSGGTVVIGTNTAPSSGTSVLSTYKAPVNSNYVDQIIVQGTGNYPSLRLGTYDAYDGVVATTGNDLRILAGLNVYTENHSIRFYTSFNGGTGGAQNYERMRIEYNGAVLIGTNTICKGLLRVAGNAEICKTLFFNGGDGNGGAIINAAAVSSCATASYNLRTMFGFNDQNNYGAYLFIHTGYNTVTGKNSTITGIVNNGQNQTISILATTLDSGATAPSVHSTSNWYIAFCWPNPANVNTKFIALAG